MIDVVFNSSNYFLNPYAIPYLIVGFIIAGEGIFVFFQNRKSLINLSYMLCDITAGLWLTGVGMIYTANTAEVSLIWARYHSFFGIIFVTPSVYFFSVWWRRASILSRDAKNSAGASGASKGTSSVIFNFICAFLFYIFCINSDLFIRGMWYYPWGFYPRAGKLYFLFVIWFYLIMALSIKNFFIVYKREKVEIKRKQTKLILIAFVIAFIGSVEFFPNYGLALYLFAFIPAFIFLSMIGYCVVRYKLMDIETVLHKTIAWFLTNVVLITPFIALVYFLQSWYLRFNNLGVLSFLGGLSLLFLFAVRVFQPKIDHFFQRRRFNLEEIANRFTEDLVHLKGVVKLTRHIEDIIKNTLYVQEANVFIYKADEKKYKLKGDGRIKTTELESDNAFLAWLPDNDKIVHRDLIEIDPVYDSIREEAKQYFVLTQAMVVIPIALGGQLLGIINLSKKLNLQRYSALDFHFLTTLKNQSAIAISNSLLYENMEEQVKQRTRELVGVQRQLIQAEKLATVGTLAGGVAHEINNPLAAILTNVQMLLASDGPADVEEAKESLELIEEATKRCRTIVKKLMAYAKKPLESAAISKVDVSEALKATISFLEYQLEQENINIAVESGQGPYLIIGSQNELEQVITNLILNARDAIKQVKKAGVIGISLSKDNHRIKIEVKDEGVGISKEVLLKIFNPFFTTKDVGKGVGLGLSICQSIIEKYAGSISAKSELNKGSVFTVQFPEAKA